MVDGRVCALATLESSCLDDRRTALLDRGNKGCLDPFLIDQRIRGLVVDGMKEIRILGR